jgi:hypothetical protein
MGWMITGALALVLELTAEQHFAVAYSPVLANDS